MKALIVLGSGGHTSQMLRLVSLLGDRYEYEYVINEDDYLTSGKIKKEVYRLRRARKIGDSKLRLLFNALMSIPAAFNVIRRSRPDAIISCGPGLTIPLFVFGKIFGTRNIYIETWSRARSASLSGRICYPLSDMFFVQWPGMTRFYPKAIYAGRLA